MHRNCVLSKANFLSTVVEHGLHNCRRSSDAACAKIPSQARVVVCGGGALGTSVAYQLTSAGWKDVIILEQNSVLGGSTLLSAGLMRRLAPSFLQTQILTYTNQSFKDLKAKGYNLGLHRSGSITLAKTFDRFDEIKRHHSVAKAHGFESEILTPEQVEKKFPYLHTADLFGALWVPKDGFINPVTTYEAVLDVAKKQGAAVFENCQVTGVQAQNGAVKSVTTNLGEIDCEYFINCAGLWSREVAKTGFRKIRVPVHPCEHQYLITHPVFPHEDQEYPIVFDLDNRMYMRAYNRGVLFGGFQSDAKVAFPSKIPNDFSQKMLPEDWDTFQPLLENILHRVPSVHNAEPMKLVNGPEAFTPDGRAILGEAPELKKYYVAAGLNAKGTAAALGLGKLLSDMIVHGYPEYETWELDPCRFLDMHNNRDYVKARIREASNWVFGINYPFRDETAHAARKVRTSSLYSSFKSQGAVFGQFMGYERPLFFVTEQMNTLPDPEFFPATFGKPAWHAAVEHEYNACRHGSGLIDLSSFSKFEIKGEGVVEYLQYLCSNDVDIPVGGIVHTGMQNERGGYENDCTITRLGPNFFLLVAPTTQQTRCKKWLKRNLPLKSGISIDDVTSAYTGINVIGPLARDLMNNFGDMSQAAFPFSLVRQTMNIGYASNVLACNITHTGEMGWVLYIPNEYALYVYECLLNFGKEYNLTLTGHYAMRTLRIERFYAFWGQDIDSTTTPFECGRAFRVKFEKERFIGRDALLKQQQEGVRRSYVQLILETHDINNDPWPWGGEPIYCNGNFAGKTTTTGYGYTLGHQVCLGFVKNIDPKTKQEQILTPEWIQSSQFEVEISGRRFPAKVNIRSPRLPAVVPNEHPDVVKYLTTQGDMTGVSKKFSKVTTNDEISKIN
ncbi:pyruvate dehydrogenase phosphatase regulatory subunit, mitochondrial-like [Paramacrobiotus metropolitanus]|uniref:pyruvate dehydrogenase phosphatase regulatory subunit, mitochondrial-like n=1 Tax=Paramacrobiotus metropolitanus TaxID=2943436 RepID=UPI00244641BC|nr:pyruvate dehydrogenase phosphatase regulatory subunit, mitochondrial-like [Paramacrobiotus metropolitanus]